MPGYKQGQSWFWATLILSSVTIAGTVFAFWELVENRFFRNLDYVSLHYLYISRGIASSLFLAMWAAWFVIRQRRRSEEKLRRSQEHYLGLLDASPSAVALVDSELRVCDWNAAAERLYGFSKEEVLGLQLQTVDAERRKELRGFMATVVRDGSVLDRETQRHDREGKVVNVQVSLLAYHENGRAFFLEVTTDIGERIRLRERLVEIEKLTAIGNMAAGTAHHLNTPLAAMLLRVQMMRDRGHNAHCTYDLEHIERSILFCQQFVRQLLEFSRHPAAQKQPETLSSIVEAVVGFFCPSVAAKAVNLHVDLAKEVADLKVLADRNQLETVLLILLSNSLDATSQGGDISLRITQPSSEFIQLTIEDNGSGISPLAAEHLFEPFFTTKPSGKGTGLGLALAKNIIAEHRGMVDVRGREGRGAVAAVTLPIHQPTVPQEVLR